MGEIIGKTLQDHCRPDRMALVVYDMQVGILRQLRNGAAVTEKVKAVLDAARRAGFPVIFLRHLSMPKPLMGRFQMRQAMAWQRTDDPGSVDPWFLRDTPGFAIAPELAPTADEAILDKITFSAFEGTPLAIILRDLGLTSFAICGVATEIGIDPTVRQGCDLGLVPIVIRDACGAGHPEAAERAFANMAFMGDAILASAEDVISAMLQ